MTVPGKSDCFVNPRRKSTFGVPASNAHSSTVPSAFFTFIWSQTCGLVHSILVTVPVNSTGFFASNSAAKAWWADTDTAVPPRHNAIPEITMTNFTVMRSTFLLSLLHRTGGPEGRHYSAPT